MCLYPKIITNKKYTETKKNGGNVPVPTDKRVLKVPVGCGVCIECRKQRAREWQVRLSEEIRRNKTPAHFVTLTFNEESLDEIINNSPKPIYEDNDIATRAIRLFLERWRKKYKKSLRHWLIAELGHVGTERIHLHGIVWTEWADEIAEIWQYGYVWIGTYVNDRTANYVTKYITKNDQDHKGWTGKIHCSPGIGRGYETTHNAYQNRYKPNGNTDTLYHYRDGSKTALPIYYRNKIYTEDEREKLWLEMLDRNERFICGEKVDISEGENDYFELLKYYKKYNAEMGYSDDPDWDRAMYIARRLGLKKPKKG